MDASRYHISGMKVKLHAEYMADDDLWLVQGIIDNGNRARADNEFYVRLQPCTGHETTPDHFKSGVLFFSNVPAGILRKAMDIGMDALEQHGFLGDDNDPS